MKQQNRLWEIDAWRGIAVLTMVLFHIWYACEYFGLIQTPKPVFLYELTGWIARVSFITIVGVSSWIMALNPQKKFKNFFKRGITIFLWGVILTITSSLIIPENTIRFGILHLIGTGIILSYFFVKKPFFSICLGVALLLLGFFLFPIYTTVPHFFWLGFYNPAVYDLDYFPLIPWFSFILIGIGLGSKLYPDKITSVIPRIFNKKAEKILVWLGQHALAIYLLHIPIIAGFFYLLTTINH